MTWHVRQSEHNHDIWEYLSKNPRCVDWEITTLFYSALHVIDEYLSSKGMRPRRHFDRNTMVQEEIEPIADAYVKLYSLCIKARYVVGFDELMESEKKDAIQCHKSICDYVQNRIP